MGSSAKKKRERKKDFQKPKLKVGKPKPKAANQTDTSFRAKAIVLNQQLSLSAPSSTTQFNHHVSLLSSRSDSQRRESLAFLTTYTELTRKSTPSMTTSSFLDKLCPLVLDGSSGVRTQLLKLLQSLPAAENTDHVSKLLPHIRAGMTHLSKDIRMSSIELLSWIISVAGKELVSCAGGWYKTLECFTTVLGWRSTDTGKWSSSNPAFGDTKSTARAMAVLAEFLEAGLFQKITKQTVNTLSETFPLWQLEYHEIPTKSNAYSHLNLFGAPRDEKTQMLEDREDRLCVYNATFAGLVSAGISASRKEGGDLGRAAGILVKVLESVEKDAPED